uniref:Selenoprotein K n=1 Tax=Parascaris univalens TaxID=6257 RepID=A0A915AVT0_PARUN
MPYIDSQGNIVEARNSFLDGILHLFAFVILFFQSLFGPFLSGGESQSDPRDRFRAGRNTGFGTGGGGRWPGSGGPGGPSYGDENRRHRQIGRLPRSSGISAPPMGCSSGG